MQGPGWLRGNPFSGVPLDRVYQRREDQAWLDARLADPATRFVAVSKSRNLILNGSEMRAFFHTRETMLGLATERTTVALLGLGEGDAEPAHFAIDVSEVPEAELLARSPSAVLMDLRELVQVIPAPEAALCAYARGLLHWHARHGFCGACGARTVSRAAGHVRLCSNPDCGASHFPRTDSAVIMLVHDGADRCILSRQSHWPPGMHSTLAGFLEPGESLEEAVAREVYEETGVRVGDVRYHSSQPWPFPASIMVGFYARATGGEFRPNPDELESAGWYSRDQLKTIGASDAFRLPNAYSIARRLVEDWLYERFPV
ncbi:MAG: NAD(+) diphosphatase [Alphaproteobacteria bacterium]